MSRLDIGVPACTLVAMLIGCLAHERAPRRPDTLRTGTGAAQLAPLPRSTDGTASPPPAVDTAPIGAASAYLDRHRYQGWSPIAADDRSPSACAGHDNGAADGVEVNALWGIARARVLGGQRDARDSTNVNVGAEVVRVISIEGDPVTSDGNYAKADMVVAGPVIDTLWIAYHRAASGWVRCGFVWRFEDDVMSPIALTGPPADTLRPRGMPLSRWVPAQIAWMRVRTLADSLSRR